MAERREKETPPSRCVICLDEMKDRAYAYPCLHDYCFLCLYQWVKLNNECPLCKRSITTIIFEIKDNGDFLELSVSKLRNGILHKVLPYSKRMLSPIPYYTPQTCPHADSREYLNDIVRREIKRKNVYESGLYVKPRSRKKRSSPELYRSDDYQVLRMRPWVTREARVLCTRNKDPHEICNQIFKLLRYYRIGHPVFYRYLKQYFGEYTHHFLHEFKAYASSQCANMTGYDDTAEYPSGSFDALDTTIDIDSDADIVVQQHERNHQTMSPVPGPSGINSRRNARTMQVMSPVAGTSAAGAVAPDETIDIDSDSDLDIEILEANHRMLSLIARTSGIIQDINAGRNIETIRMLSPVPGPSGLIQDVNSRRNVRTMQVMSPTAGTSAAGAVAPDETIDIDSDSDLDIEVIEINHRMISSVAGSSGIIRDANFNFSVPRMQMMSPVAGPSGINTLHDFVLIDSDSDSD